MRSLKDRQRQEEIADGDERDLVSRSDRRRVRVEREDQLKELALSLVALKPKQRQRVLLPEYVVESIDKARAMASPKARNRQVLVVRQHLRDLDADQVQRQVQDILFPPVRPASNVAPWSQPVANVDEPDSPLDATGWQQRLLQLGDQALGELLALYPHANRQTLRQQVRAVQKDRQSLAEQPEREGDEGNPALVAQLRAAEKRSSAKLRASLQSLVRR